LNSIPEWCEAELAAISDSFIANLFPLTKDKKLLELEKLNCQSSADKQPTQKQGGPSPIKSPVKIGVVFSGGPAPGGHNVIAGLYQAVQALAPGSKLVGFVGGPDGLLGDKHIEITEATVASYWNTGGFNMLATGRTKIDTPEKFTKAFATIASHKLGAFVVVGGDDSNTNAAYLAEYAEANQIPVAVVGVPKTIDGDLRSEYLPISFGFDTASSVYATLVGNLCKDALSSRKYYHFVRLMGRNASHLTLETGLRCRTNLTLIAEECLAEKKSLTDIVSDIADMVEARAEQGKSFGVILVPEGLLEQLVDVRSLIEELNALLRAHGETFANAKNEDTKVELSNRLLSPEASQTFSSFPEYIQHQLLADRDSHGNVPLSAIETEKLIGHMASTELSIRGKLIKNSQKFKPLYHFFGYEGRCAAPTAFDRVFSHSLGQVAACLAVANKNGYLAAVACSSAEVESWKMYGVPLVSMLVKEVRGGHEVGVIQKVLVDLKSPAFQSFKQSRNADRLSDNYCYNGPYVGGGKIHLPLII
jgi:pyrophosphate--fructose-6-phosphate 1-phosphotransferase